MLQWRIILLRHVATLSNLYCYGFLLKLTHFKVPNRELLTEDFLRQIQ